MDILNKGVEQKLFEGEPSERNVLIHAIRYLSNESTLDTTTRIFPNIHDDRLRKNIEAVLAQSGFFTHKQAGIWKQFELNDSTNRHLLSISIENLVDKCLLTINLSKEADQMKIYILSACKVLSESKIGHELVWRDVVKRAQIPDSVSEAVKSLMIHKKYIVKSLSTRGMGDFVRANDSVFAALYEMETEVPAAQLNQTINVGRDVNGALAIGNANVYQQETILQNLDFVALKNELQLIRDTLVAVAKTTADYQAIGHVASAQLSAEAKNSKDLLEHLKAAGKWVTDAARDISANVISDLITKGLM